MARPAEQELLLACAQVGEEPARVARVAAALALRPDPEGVRRLARAHGVVPLVAARVPAVSTVAPGAGGGWEELQAEARRIARRNLVLTGELIARLRSFEAAGIQILPFKGPTLAVAAYGSLAARPFADLDLLVRHEQFQLASEQLLAHGYVQNRDGWFAVRHLSHEVAFDGQQGRVQIDLHRRLFSRELPALDSHRLWQAADRVLLAGHEVPVPDAETMALLLCEHGHKHGWSRLIWIADLAHWIESRPALDWPRLLARARRSGSLRVLAVALGLAERLLALPVPEAARGALFGDATARRLASQVERRLFDPLAEGLEAKVELNLLQWRGRERWRDRVRFAITPNEDDWIVLPLPAPLFAIYYLVRPLRLLVTYGRSWLRPRRRG